jgi:hypothetical protein
MSVHAVGGRYEIEPATPHPEPVQSTLFGVGRGIDRAALDRAAAVLAL